MAGVSSLERWWLDSWWHRLGIRRYVSALLKACPEPFRGQVLEVGSGSGWTSRRVLETFPQVELTAVDIDPRAEQSFASLQNRYGQRLRFKQADLLRLPFDRGSFDMVLAIHVLRKVEDHRGAVRQFLRVLRPGGLIGLCDEKPTRDVLQAQLKQEGAQVLVATGASRYYIWARKPYPYADEPEMVYN